MARIVGKISRKKGKFYYIDSDGNIVEASRSEMMRGRKKKSKSKRRR